MSEVYEMKVIARIHNDFPTKFGIPHQSNRLEALKATIVFEPEYRVAEALHGLEEYSYIWLIWQFSTVAAEYAAGKSWRPTVRPPRLGGNTRMGVFATRSPFRPNSIALSCVKLAGIEETAEHSTVLRILGADLMDGTPILDIKPYIPYADSHPEALGGFAAVPAGETLEVVIPPELLEKVPENRREGLIQVVRNSGKCFPCAACPSGILPQAPGRKPARSSQSARHRRPACR